MIFLTAVTTEVFFLLSQYFMKEQFDTFATDVMFSGQRFVILTMFFI